jgi:hypothetical protein
VHLKVFLAIHKHSVRLSVGVMGSSEDTVMTECSAKPVIDGSIKAGLQIIFQPEEYVTFSVLGQGVFDSPSLTLVIDANIIKKMLIPLR